MLQNWFVVLLIQHRIVGPFESKAKAYEWFGDWRGDHERSRVGFIAHLESPFKEVETKIEESK